MIGYGNATLPRKPGMYVEMRRHVCRLWPGACGRDYTSHSGRESLGCPECQRTAEFKAWKAGRKRAQRRVYDAKRRQK